MIKQGYMLRVTSWENDGDHYNNVTIEGLTEPQARWLVRFLEQLAKLGQVETKETNLIEVAAVIDVPYAGFPGWGEYGSTCPEDVQEKMQDLVYELLGPDCEYTGRMRVADSWDVHFIPFDIPDIKI